MDPSQTQDAESKPILAKMVADILAADSSATQDQITQTQLVTQALTTRVVTDLKQSEGEEDLFEVAVQRLGKIGQIHRGLVDRVIEQKQSVARYLNQIQPKEINNES